MVSLFLKQLANPLEQIVLYTYPGSVRFLSHHSGGVSLSRVCYGFLYFVRFPSLITIVFIFYLLVIFPSQTRIRVNIKVVRCLKQCQFGLYSISAKAKQR